jgi:hypothetical protein
MHQPVTVNIYALSMKPTAQRAELVDIVSDNSTE